MGNFLVGGRLGEGLLVGVPVTGAGGTRCKIVVPATNSSEFSGSVTTTAGQ